MVTTLEKIYEIQERYLKKSRNPYAISDAFQDLNSIFATIPLVPGVYTGTVVEKPPLEILIDNKHPDTIAYKKFKQEYNKFKAPQESACAWGKDTEKFADVKVLPNGLDKLGLLTGNTPRGCKCKFLVVDIDDLNIFLKHDNYFNIKSWNPTITVRSGLGFHLYYLINDSRDYKCRRITQLGTDIRGNGGYIVSPISIHPLTHQLYRLEKGKFNDNLPEAIFEMSAPPQIIADISQDDSVINNIINNKHLFSVPLTYTNTATMQLEYNNNISSINTSINHVNNNTQITDSTSVSLTIDEATYPASVQSSDCTNVIFDMPDKIKEKFKNLPSDLRDLIFNGNPSDRSNASFLVKYRLLQHQWLISEIKYIYDHFAIGEKDREKAKYHFFEHTMDRALHSFNENRNSYDASLDPLNDYGMVSLLDISKRKIEIQYLIEPFLYKQCKLLVTGSAGSFKSHLALQICIDLLNPKKNLFLESFLINNNNRPKNILIINGENTDYDLSYKNDALRSEMTQEEYELIAGHIQVMAKKGYTMFRDNLDSDIFIEAIKLRIIESEADLLIIDNLQCYHENQENDNSDMRNTLDRLVPILTEFDIPLIMIHHTAKGASKDNFSRGAASIRDWCSDAVVLEKTRDKVTLRHAKSRNSKLYPDLELEYNGNRLISKNGIASPTNVSVKKDEDIVTDIIIAHNGRYNTKGDLVKAVQEEFKKLDKKSCSSIVTKLIDSMISNNKLINGKGKGSSKPIELPTLPIGNTN